jgi:ArsR family transcriptional regulator
MEPKCCVDKKSVAGLSRTVEFLKIISEKNRLKILCLLKEGEKCVCDIWQCLDLAQNLVSHHLKVLKNFGLISSKRQGLKVFYQLNQGVVKKYLKLLNNLLNSYEE